MNNILFLLSFLLISSTIHATEASRIITKIKLASGQTVVVAEGDFEARSIGSYSVRLYGAPDETTFFLSGLIRARDGVVEKVVLADINGDKQQEVIIIVRSVGTGSYLSAQAFEITKGNLVFLAAVEGLPPDADPVNALRKTVNKRE